MESLTGVLLSYLNYSMLSLIKSIRTCCKTSVMLSRACWSRKCSKFGDNRKREVPKPVPKWKERPCGWITLSQSHNLLVQFTYKRELFAFTLGISKSAATYAVRHSSCDLELALLLRRNSILA